MPRIEMQELSQVLNKKTYIDTDVLFWEINEHQMTFGSPFIDYFDDHSLEFGRQKHYILEEIFSQNINGFSHRSTRGEKETLLKAMEKDIEKIPDEYQSIKRDLQQRNETDRILPVLSDRMIYEFPSQQEKKSYSALKEYLLKHPDHPYSSVVKEMIFDKNNNQRFVLTASEFLLKPLNLRGTEYFIDNIFHQNPELQGKRKNVLIAENSAELLTQVHVVAGKFANNQIRDGEVISFVVQEEQTNHLTSVTMVKDNHMIWVYGSDSIAGDETYKKTFVNVVNELKNAKELNDFRIENAYTRFNSQRNNGSCGVYTFLDTLEMQSADPEKVLKIINQAVQFDKNEKYLAEKMIRIVSKLDSKAIDENKRNHLEEKLTEYSIYLSAMTHIRENPERKTVDNEKVYVLLLYGYTNLQKMLQKEDVRSRNDDSQKLYRYAKDNLLNMVSVFERNKEKVMTAITMDRVKLAMIGELITGKNDARKFTNFKTDKELKDMNERYVRKHEKTIKILGRKRKEL